MAAAALFCTGIAMMASGVASPDRRSAGPSALERLLARLSDTRETQQQNLRLAGIAPRQFALHRLSGVLFGLVVGVLLSRLLGRGPAGTVVLAGLVGGGGWVLPYLGVNDTARKARAEIDQMIRVWIALVAQQVSAGADPTAAMLTAARVGKRRNWRLLHRFLLAAQQNRRPAWEGLADIVERYGIHTLSPVVSALGLATERGTRLSDALLVAADTLWKETTQRDREKASRRAQIVVVPATGVALALAAILIYPPFTSLTGGVITPGTP